MFAAISDAFSRIDWILVFCFLLSGGGFLWARKSLKGNGIADLAKGLADQAVQHALMGATGILDGITPQNAADRVDGWVWAELAKHGIAKNDGLDLLVKPAIASGVSRVLEGLRAKIAAEEPLGGVPLVVVAKTPQAGFANVGVLLAIIAIGGLLLGCAWFSSEKKAVVSDVIDCTKAEASKAITEFGPVLDQLLVYATGGNGTVNTDAVAAAAKGFGKDIGGCVLADAVARALKPAPVGSGAPKSSPLEADPESLRRALALTLPGAHYHTANGDL